MDRQQLVIVALGSSSTQGVQASSPARSYPAVLQAALAQALPDQHVAVINRGISGQDAARELARMEADAIAVRPQLVIWQVGANAALGAADPAAFRKAVIDGVRHLHAAGIDVVLMDNQRSPRILAAREDAMMDRALAEVADSQGASLFSRDTLMSGWEREGSALTAFVADDGLHHNDLGYRCVARSLAGMIIKALVAGGATAHR